MIQSSQGVIDKRVLYAKAVYGDEEKQAVLESMNNGWLAAGPKVAEFEQTVAKIFRKKYGVATNSGSSANLLAIASLDMPKGSEVITPACTFSTTVSEIVYNGLIPMFVDSIPGRYTIDEAQVEDAITDNTRAIMVPQLIGGTCDMRKLREIADKYGLFLIDDSCDTWAPKLTYEKGHSKSVAEYADITTTSFYGSHLITCLGMGGMLMTDDEEIRDRAITMRDWGRVGNDREDFDKRFDFNIDGIPYDSKFLYTELGFNLKMNEAAAAFGLEQIKRLPDFVGKRSGYFGMMLEFFKKWEKWFVLPSNLGWTVWLAFPLCIKDGAPFTRYHFLRFLEANGIQTRVLFSGNITRHPVYKKINYRSHGELKNADFIMARGLLLGCHHGLEKEDVAYMLEMCNEFLSVQK